MTGSLFQGLGDWPLSALLMPLQLLPAAGAGTVRALSLLASAPHKQPMASESQTWQLGLLCLVHVSLPV